MLEEKQKIKENIFKMWEESDLIFHDCEFAEYPNSVHAQFHQLNSLPDRVKAKMWLYHYSLGNKTYEEFETLAKENGFAGLVKRGQEFIL